MHPVYLGTLALIAWSAILIFSGAICVLASQVGKLCELLEKRAQPPRPPVEVVSPPNLEATLGRHHA